MICQKQRSKERLDFTRRSSTSHSSSPCLFTGQEVEGSFLNGSSVQQRSDSYSDFRQAYVNQESTVFLRPAGSTLSSGAVAVAGTTTSASTISTLSGVVPSSSSSSLRTRFRVRKRDILLCHSLLIVTSVVTAIMNAAITIFGMGVGVGLILGDTLRGSNISNSHTATATSTQTAHAVDNHHHHHHQQYNDTNTSTGMTAVQATESSVVVVRQASPYCRAMIRRSAPIAPTTTGTPTAATMLGRSRMPAQ